jgi:hypothetical protein
MAAGAAIGSANANAAAANANAAAANAYTAGYAAGATNATVAKTAYAVGTTVVTLPAGCISPSVSGGTYYLCGNTWFSPFYGANGLYYRVVPAP